MENGNKKHLMIAEFCMMLEAVGAAKEHESPGVQARNLLIRREWHPFLGKNLMVLIHVSCIFLAFSPSHACTLQ